MLEGQNTPGFEAAKMLNLELRIHNPDNGGNIPEPDDSKLSTRREGKTHTHTTREQNPCRAVSESLWGKNTPAAAGKGSQHY